MKRNERVTPFGDIVIWLCVCELVEGKGGIRAGGGGGGVCLSYVNSWQRGFGGDGKKRRWELSIQLQMHSDAGPRVDSESLSCLCFSKYLSVRGILVEIKTLCDLIVLLYNIPLGYLECLTK